MSKQSINVRLTKDANKILEAWKTLLGLSNRSEAIESVDNIIKNKSNELERTI